MTPSAPTDTTPGTLYVVATPIGNLEDITLRALRVLKEADIVAAEDTRHTRKLFSAHNIHTPLTSYHDHNKEEKAPVLIARMREGATVALVSDAGTPLINDPGYFLVNRAHEAGLAVLPIPGASSVTAALSVAGLPTDAFTFLGYPPPKSAARQRLLALWAEHPHTLVLLESPYRIVKLLNDIRAALGDRQVAICRELTKRHEEVLRGSAEKLLERFSTGKPKGEFTVLIEGLTRKAKQAEKKDRKAESKKRPKTKPE